MKTAVESLSNTEKWILSDSLRSMANTFQECSGTFARRGRPAAAFSLRLLGSQLASRSEQLRFQPFDDL